AHAVQEVVQLWLGGVFEAIGRFEQVEAGGVGVLLALAGGREPRPQARLLGAKVFDDGSVVREWNGKWRHVGRKRGSWDTGARAIILRPGVLAPHLSRFVTTRFTRVTPIEFAGRIAAGH